MKSRLKICGLMRAEDVSMCCLLGVDICGFVTEYPLAVPWNLSRKQCAKLLPCVVPPSKSCIVTGGKKEKILELAKVLHPVYVQLHFKETIQDVEYLVSKLATDGIRVIKTIPLSEKERLEQFGVVNLEDCVRMLSQVGATIILVDSRGASNAGSRGSTIDFSIYEKIRGVATCPVMIAGGITPQNVRLLRNTVTPDIIDVMSGVEVRPGVKSKEKIVELTRVCNNEYVFSRHI